MAIDKSLGYIYRGDNHGWLFGWKNGHVFQAGPAVAMNWYGTSNTGSQAPAGNRASDTDSMCGNAVLYDAVGGNILTVGGAPAYVGKCIFPNNIDNPTVPFSLTFARLVLRS